ncbi:hypothetical protein Bca52824_003176 [Brassica carinata]|uniref:Uncharacterized protein n=1 Tax=Brassica carinata TaxID=52824 RepID=A0A8X7WKM3_BRACI|nr:hypothetical protein Bca52824_003176 [Brassica carinata]
MAWSFDSGGLRGGDVWGGDDLRRRTEITRQLTRRGGAEHRCCWPEHEINHHHEPSLKPRGRRSDIDEDGDLVPWKKLGRGEASQR